MEIVREGESRMETDDGYMDDRRREDRRSGHERRSDYNGRQTVNVWQILFTLLVTVLIALVSFATSVLNDIKRDVRATSDRQIEDRASYANLARDLDKANNKIDTVVLAFQYNVNGRLNYLEAKTGYKAPKEMLQPPQQPLLQGD